MLVCKDADEASAAVLGDRPHPSDPWSGTLVCKDADEASAAGPGGPPTHRTPGPAVGLQGCRRGVGCIRGPPHPSDPWSGMLVCKGCRRGVGCGPGDRPTHRTPGPACWFAKDADEALAAVPWGTAPPTGPLVRHVGLGCRRGVGCGPGGPPTHRTPGPACWFARMPTRRRLRSWGTAPPARKIDVQRSLPVALGLRAGRSRCAGRIPRRCVQGRRRHHCSRCRLHPGRRRFGRPGERAQRR